MERAVVEHGLHLVEDVPAFAQRRLKKKALRASIFGGFAPRRGEGELRAYVGGWVGGWLMDGWR